MEMKKNITLDEVSYSLRVMKYFVNYKTYKSLMDACRMKISEKNLSREFGTGRLSSKPSVSDFLKANNLINEFLLLEKGAEKGSEILNEQGYHSSTVVKCINVLFQNCDYQCIEQLLSMIDEKDSNEEARAIRKNLLTTRNNLTRVHTRKALMQKQEA